MNVLDLFSGIGGFSLGFEQAGLSAIGFCEITPWCRAVLQQRWPNVPIHADIRKLDGRAYAGAADIVCGGYPCQPFSVAGLRRARMMKDISGRRCIESYEKSGRDGSLPKTLLDILSSVSTRLPHRWSLRVLKSGRSYFRLAPLARGTGGIASGLLPTPLASDCKGVSPNCRKLKEHDLSMLRYFLHSLLCHRSTTSYPHPAFVEAMMGYPTGHTVLGRLATQSFRTSRRASARRSSITKKQGHCSIDKQESDYD